ncbi:MAG: chemotaxis protein CheX [Gammaproteobacteria bacterium]|nr:chemotaxis protein CheX [Gammaproteobacteria bacterium]
MADLLHIGKENMDILIINALLDSLMKIFNTMIGVMPEPGIPTPKSDDISLGEVTGMMLMEAEMAKGSMAISFSQGAIAKVANKMLGDKLKKIDDAAKDLTGEMTNMLVGGAKSILAERGYDFDMSTPEILSGKQHKIEHKYDGQTVILPFTLDKDKFYLEINFQ